MFDWKNRLCYHKKMKNPNENLYAVVLAGGYGERFWPWSRESRPKQFLPIAGAEPMLRATVERIRPLIPPERVFVCTNSGFHGRVSETVPEIPGENIISEPERRNTAPAVGLSCSYIGGKNENAVIAVLPADHVIKGKRAFLAALKRAARAAGDGESLVVFGVRPGYPETGYGYIKSGKPASFPAGKIKGAFVVERFEEKPDRAAAERFLSTGGYYWNSGMFVWSYRAISSEMKKHAPGLYRGLRAAGPEAGGDKNRLREAYKKMPSISVDYAVMEKTRRAVMIEADFGWFDVGSWNALGGIYKENKNGNIAPGGRFLGIDSKNSIIAAGDAFVACVGVSDVIVAVAKDAVLVCARDRAQDVKKIVEELRKSGNLKNLT